MRIHLAVAVTVVTVAAAIATAVTYAGVGDRHRANSRFGCNLTEEQKTAIRDKVIEMKKAGASREDLRATRSQMLEAFGCNVPEGSRRDHGRAGHLSQLSEEQRTAVREMVKEMKQKGASREAIRASVRQMLRSFGISAPGVLGSGAPVPLKGTSSAEPATWGAIKSMF
jgi:hypothetical protein